MTIWEYRCKVSELSIVADRLAAVVSLLNTYHFEDGFNEDEPASHIWWAQNHDRIQEVVGMIAETVTSVKVALAELSNTAPETEEEAQE